MNGDDLLRKRVWHYTDARCLRSILLTGCIRTSEAIDRRDLRIPPVVWLSTNSTCELASRACAELDLWGLQDFYESAWPVGGRGLARIEVQPVRVYGWAEYMADAGVPDRGLLRLAELGYEAGGDPNDWVVTSAAVPAREWRAIETWNGTEWVRVADGGTRAAERNPGEAGEPEGT